MISDTPALDLARPAAELTGQLVDIESVSGNEQPLADAIARALGGLPHLTVHKDGNALVARTDFGRAERVVVAGNVIPDECVVSVNYRFAPDRSPEQAAQHVREVFGGWDVAVTDVAGGARPGLGQPAAASFAAAMGGTPRAKLGWTDVARFDALGIPAVNFGPGDPQLAHSRDEHVPLAQVAECEQKMLAWLSA